MLYRLYDNAMIMQVRQSLKLMQKLEEAGAIRTERMPILGKRVAFLNVNIKYELNILSIRVTIINLRYMI
jgi:hypothetical protein